MIVYCDEVQEDHGSVVVFNGYLDEAGTRPVSFGVDHRMAGGLIEALEIHGIVTCHVEPWHLLGGVG